jgi:hypothetical protein
MNKKSLFLLRLYEVGSWGTSVSIVSDYRLDYRPTGVRPPAETKDFSSNLCVQTSSEAYSASYPLGTGGPFPGVKRGRGVTLTIHAHLVLRSRMNKSYNFFPPCRLHGDSRTTLLLLYGVEIERGFFLTNTFRIATFILSEGL